MALQQLLALTQACWCWPMLPRYRVGLERTRLLLLVVLLLQLPL